MATLTIKLPSLPAVSHVLTDEVAEALTRVQKSRNKSRSKLLRAG